MTRSDSQTVMTHMIENVLCIEDNDSMHLALTQNEITSFLDFMALDKESIQAFKFQSMNDDGELQGPTRELKMHEVGKLFMLVSYSRFLKHKNGGRMLTTLQCLGIEAADYDDYRTNGFQPLSTTTVTTSAARSCSRSSPTRRQLPGRSLPRPRAPTTGRRSAGRCRSTSLLPSSSCSASCRSACRVAWAIGPSPRTQGPRVFVFGFRRTSCCRNRGD